MTVYVPGDEGRYRRAMFDGETIYLDGAPVPCRMTAVVFTNGEDARDAVLDLARQVQDAGYSCFVRPSRR
jgi:hypothetical protein